MTTESAKDRRLQCPSCEAKAKRVSTVTIDALLSDEFAQQFQADGHSCCASDHQGCASIQRDTGWRFCDSTDCEVVYFSEEGDTAFSKSQLRVSVGVKETTGERPLCYCFKHSVATIKDELRTTGSSVAFEDIRAKMKDPGCGCETENPSGSCCLGSVGKGIKIARMELAADVSDAGSQPGKPSSNKGEKVAKVGTLVSAIMASACCWLPLVLLGVGVSGAGIAATLEEYRPYFIVITFGFLGAAFYYTYRPKKATEPGGGHDCCAAEPTDGDACCAPANGHFNMMAMNKVMLWGVTVMAVAFLLFPSYVGAFLGTDKDNQVTEDMHETVIKIKGLTCEGCSAIAGKAIRKAPGVLAVEVNYARSEAIVGTATGAEFLGQRILKSLRDAGYSGHILDGQSSPSIEPSIQKERK